MFRILVAIFTLAIPFSVLPDEPVESTVDLRTPGALENLKRTNPAHFEKIRDVLAGLQEQPSRVEGDWLQTTFDARDVNLSTMVIKTSLPPKQLLSFSLERVRYTMYVTRRDFTAEFRKVD